MRYSLLTFLILFITACGGGGGDSPAQTTPVVVNTPSEPDTPTTPTTPTTPATPSNQQAIEAGETIFRSAATNGNQFSCSSCHSPQENINQQSTSDQFRRVAPPLFNAAKQSSFHNGISNQLFDAVNICRQDWMDSPILSDASQTWLDLNAYLVSLQDDSSLAEINTTQVLPLQNFDQADADLGQELFNQTCAACHGDDAQGGELATTLIKFDFSSSQAGAEFVANKVRTSGPQDSQVFANLSGGNMPFWGQERLTDDELKHIAEYVVDVNRPVLSGLTCSGTNHPAVGTVAQLSTLAHNVSGRAEIIDNCTIEITNFNYDGGGPSVLFYLAQDAAYVNGFGIGSRIDGTVYENQTIRLSLQNPSDLERFNSISVWCADFNANFGDGIFE